MHLASERGLADNSLHAYRFVDDTGGSRYVRYRWEPEAGEASLSTEDAEVMVVAPALQENALHFWLSDADQAIAKAEQVRQASLRQLDSEGVAATGDTGESDPLEAIPRAADAPGGSVEGTPSPRTAS